jgi:hypothetical protein
VNQLVNRTKHYSYSIITYYHQDSLLSYIKFTYYSKQTNKQTHIHSLTPHIKYITSQHNTTQRYNTMTTMNQGIPTSLDHVQFDFEEYVLKHGIPDTIDPLPYRKAGSVFATGDEAEPQVTSAKNDPRLRTVVCRHWLRDLCMKGAACEFLHQYDLSKMPLCRHGDRW